MMNDYQPSDELIAFIKRPETEGLVLVPSPDPVGIITYGWGHRTYPGEYIPPAITQDAAELLLTADLHKAGAAVRRLVTVEMTQAQFDGLTDFTFNLGEARLAASTMLQYVNRSDWEGAAEQCKLWVHDHAGHVLPGLVTRRAWDAEHLIPVDTSAEWDPTKVVVPAAVVFPPTDVDPSPSAENTQKSDAAEFVPTLAADLPQIDESLLPKTDPAPAPATDAPSVP